MKRPGETEMNPREKRELLPRARGVEQMRKELRALGVPALDLAEEKAVREIGALAEVASAMDATRVLMALALSLSRTAAMGREAGAAAPATEFFQMLAEDFLMIAQRYCDQGHRMMSLYWPQEEGEERVPYLAEGPFRGMKLGILGDEKESS